MVPSPQCHYYGYSKGIVRDFNTSSAYARDLFSRLYCSTAKDTVECERKHDMKKRIRRSPDDGDSFVYMVEGCKRSGMFVIRDIYLDKDKERLKESQREIGFDPDALSPRPGEKNFSRGSLVESY